MSLQEPIKIFEYDNLEWDDKRWSKSINDSSVKKSLEWLEKKQNSKPFSYTANGIKAKQHVGVVSLGRDIVQVLPKIFSNSNSSTNITGLMYLLQLTKKLKFSEVDLAKLSYKTDNMLEIFIKLFANNLIMLLQNDFRRNYVPQEDNLKFVKGKINFTQHIRHNYVDKSKLYCNYDEYEANILLNQLLKATVKKCISATKTSFSILQKCDQLLADVDTKRFTNPNICKKVKFTRLNQKYKYVFELAKLLLFGNSPKLDVSNVDTFSIMFDMNKLFEEAIFTILNESKSEFEFKEVQEQKPQKTIFDKSTKNDDDDKFNFTMKPDIHIVTNNNDVIIIDTKYKKIEKVKADYNSKQKGVSQSDVYQMFAYSQYYNAEKCILLYPKFNHDIREEISNDNPAFKLQVFTVDLHLDNDKVSFAKFKEKVKKDIKEQLNKCPINTTTTKPSHG